MVVPSSGTDGLLVALARLFPDLAQALEQPTLPPLPPPVRLDAYRLGPRPLDGPTHGVAS
jgi:hypothetical protein